MIAGLLAEGATAERTRGRIEMAGQIKDLVALARRSNPQIPEATASALIAEGKTVEQARAALFDKMVARDEEDRGLDAARPRPDGRRRRARGDPVQHARAARAPRPAYEGSLIMATTLLNPILVSDWLKYESPNYHSRDTAILAAGSGIVVSGPCWPSSQPPASTCPRAAAGSDGSQTAVACLIEGADGRTTVDTTGSDQRVVILSRHADVSHAGLTYGPTITDATKRAAAQGQLAAVGIVTREGA